MLELFDIDPASVEVIEEFELAAPAREAIRDLQSSRQQLERPLATSQSQLKKALAELRGGMRLSTRDAADLVGISHQRVAQLQGGNRRTTRRREPTRSHRRES